MSRYGNRILVIFVSVLFSGLVSAQDRIQETKLLVKTTHRGLSESPSGALGSKLFAYSRYQGLPRQGENLYRLEGEKEVLLFETLRLGQEVVQDVQVARDDSRIVFRNDGYSSGNTSIIYSVRPDGSQLTELAQSGESCDEFRWPGYGTPFCSHPVNARLSPDGQKVIFVNEVRAWDEESQGNYLHEYLSMVPVTGGPIVRLEEIGNGVRNYQAAWSEDSASIYYYSGWGPSDERLGNGRFSERWNGLLRRYDLETGRSEQIMQESWKILRQRGLAVSRADGWIYFVDSKRGFARLAPETGFAEVISEEVFDSFDLSPDGHRAAGVKDGNLTIVDLEFPPGAPLQVDPGAIDELKLSQIPATRERWLHAKLSKAATSYEHIEKLSSQAVEKNGVLRTRWIDNERLWCVVHEDTSIDPITATASNPEVRVGIVRLY